MHDRTAPPIADPGFHQRVIDAAQRVLTRSGSVGPIELFAQIKVLNPVHLESWRKGYETHAILEDWIQLGPAKKAKALEVFRSWCLQHGLKAVEASYVRRTSSGVIPLLVTRNREPAEELFYRTHYTKPDLGENKSKRLTEKLNKVVDLTVFEQVSDHGVCSECGVELGQACLFVLEQSRVFCLECADLDHLIFLAAGDATLSRRSRKRSALSAVVVRFNRSRKRYERQGILVTAEALALAEEECAADAGERAVRRERDAGRRAEGDLRLAESVEKLILRRFPNCPSDEARVIAKHTTVRASGRVGRSAAGRELDPGAVDRAVVAHIRHQHTEYDKLLMEGVERLEARGMIRGRVDAILMKWRG